MHTKPDWNGSRKLIISMAVHAMSKKKYETFLAIFINVPYQPDSFTLVKADLKEKRVAMEKN